ncbi:hypothetical protein [Chitinophaga sp.]|uniref:glycine-rich domain-containing protein n=1 Tax=Chitinophaga sp. TaxID=1869181 RepID=UPI002F9499A4
MKNNHFIALSPGTLLWQQISEFRLDDPDAAVPFSRKLARENKWDAAFTQRAIQEYKRFIYLCCISPTGASPSEIVDKVWHQHLLYTQNYWEAFCEKTLGQKIHHYPSSGGPSEKQKYIAWEESTRQQYRQYFGEDPPAAIWPDHSAPATLPVTQRLSLFRKYWFPFLLFFLSVFLFPGCSSDSLPGVVIVAILVFGSFGAMAVNKEDKNPKKNNTGDGSNCSSGSSCSSSCGSSCSSCSSGCGGCGGS